MICHGVPSWRVSPEIVITELQDRHGSCGRRILDGGRHQQQLRSALSPVDLPGPSLPNYLQDVVLPAPNSLLCYGPVLRFRSRIIVDLLPAQESTMGIDQKIYSFSASSSSSHFSHSHSRNSGFSKVGFNSGQSLWHPKGELAGMKRNGGKAGAGWVSISSEASQENSERRRKTEGGSSGGMFDSNAENVRRRRFTRTGYNSSVEPQSPPPFSFEGRSRNTQSRGGREWDYESPDADDEPRASPSWQQRVSNFFDASDDEDDEDEDDEDRGLFSWLDTDLPAALTVFRWGLPALFLLGFAGLPSILGNPFILLLGFSLFPSLSQALNPLAKQFVRAVSSSFRDSSSSRRKRRFRSQTSRTNYKDQEPARYNVNGSSAQTAGRNPDPDLPRQDSSLGPSVFGGWDDLAEDRNGPQSSSQWPLQKRKKSSKKVARRGQPLFIRIILALFPFLRGWGGSL